MGANSPWGETSFISFSIMASGAIAEHPAHFEQPKFLAPAVPQWPNKIYAIKWF